MQNKKPGAIIWNHKQPSADEPEGVLAGVGFIKGGITMAIKNAYLNNVYQDLAGVTPIRRNSCRLARKV